MVIRDTSAQDVDLGASGSRKRNRVRLIGASVVVVVVAVVGWAAVSDIGTAEQFVSRDRVRTAVVRRGDFVRDIAVQGRVVAAVSPTLYAPDPGTVTLSVVAGDSVAVGQVLAVIESAEILSLRLQERATLASAEVNLERQRIQVKKEILRNQQAIDLAMVARTAAERESRRAESAAAAITQHERDRASDEVVS
ncbi:MAG: hypothetical protein V3R27_05255, partial [Pseudomonadales bacterium]